MIFPKGKLDWIESDIRREAVQYRHLGADKWLAEQRTLLSQFGGESREAPPDDTLKSIGFLIWASSLYEEKVSRAVFWLESLKACKIVELPGQGTKLSSRLGQLNKRLQDKDVSSILGADGVELIRSAVNRATQSLQFRDDVVHGHRLGFWSKNTLLRTRGKTFDAKSARFVKVSPRAAMQHGNTILGAAAVVALVDHYFDTSYSG